MKSLTDSFDQGHVILDLNASNIATAIRGTIQQAVVDKIIPPQIEEQVISALLQREQEAPTAIGHATGVPHAYLDEIDEQIILLVRLAHPVNLGAPDGIPTRFLYFLLGPPGSAVQHLDTLANIARVMSDDEFRYEMGRARSKDDLLEALDHFTQRTTIEPESTEEKLDSLTYTGQLCGGIKQDILRRLPHYASDFTDGMNAKSIASIMFLFFACLAPALTFGGIMGIRTGGDIGVVEMLVASAACGIIYSLLSGQPLIILGGVGPLLVFTAILYQLTTDLQLEFLPTYAWVGFWTAAILIILAVTDASYLMRYFTRFTDELFSALMALLFIYESTKAIVGILHDSFVDDQTAKHDAAFLSLILAIGTFFIATNLLRFRRSKYLLPWMREFLADFGPMIALAMMTLVAWLLKTEVTISLLQAPDTIQTTNGRDWLVNPLAAPMWVRFAAIVPALVAALLVYLTQNITARLINSPDHKLHKGSAYHWDLGLVGLMIGVCSMFGLPWLVAATVRSLAHVRGQAVFDQVIRGNGEATERVTHVNENRVTGLAIHILIALSLLMLSTMKVVPMAVLYGIFLFMGVVSLSGNQFMERLTLWLMEPDLYPKTHYIRQAPVRVIHKFTLLQLICLAILCAITLSPYETLQLSFPLFIALLVPVRFLAGRWFEPKYLDVLDAEETPHEEETHWSA